MITISVLKLLANNNIGVLMLTGDEEIPESNPPLIPLYFEKLPVDKVGVYLVNRGDTLSRGTRTSQSFDLYARGSDDIEGAEWLDRILRFFAETCYSYCELPIVEGYSEATYKRTSIQPTFNVSSLGQDSTDRVIYLASAQVIYKKEN